MGRQGAGVYFRKFVCIYTLYIYTTASTEIYLQDLVHKVPSCLRPVIEVIYEHLNITETSPCKSDPKFAHKYKSGGSYCKNRRHLLQTGGKSDVNQTPDSDIPNILSSGAGVTDYTNLLSATPLSPVKSPPKQSKSESTNISSQPYITRFGHVCKSKIKESM